MWGGDLAHMGHVRRGFIDMMSRSPDLGTSSALFWAVYQRDVRLTIELNSVNSSMLGDNFWILFDYFVRGKGRPAVRSRAVTIMMVVGYFAVVLAIVCTIYAR